MGSVRASGEGEVNVQEERARERDRRTESAGTDHGEASAAEVNVDPQHEIAHLFGTATSNRVIRTSRTAHRQSLRVTRHSLLLVRKLVKKNKNNTEICRETA